MWLVTPLLPNIFRQHSSNRASQLAKPLWFRFAHRWLRGPHWFWFSLPHRKKDGHSPCSAPLLKKKCIFEQKHHGKIHEAYMSVENMRVFVEHISKNFCMSWPGQMFRWFLFHMNLPYGILWYSWCSKNPTITHEIWKKKIPRRMAWRMKYQTQTDLCSCGQWKETWFYSGV